MAYNPNQPRHPAGSDQGGEWARVGIALSSTEERAYEGRTVDTESRLTKQETGEIGEKAVLAYLYKKGLVDARPMNMERSNFPVDLIEDHELIEVKTGLVSNGASAQQWRATIGQPGKAEREWLKVASPEEKRTWNAEKAAAILARKKSVLAQYQRRTGQSAKGKTMAVIIDPDRKIADVYEFDGFHLRIGWNSLEAKRAYKESFSYATK